MESKLNQIQSLINDSKYTEALKLIKQDANLYKDNLFEVQLNVYESKIYRYLGDFEKSLSILHNINLEKIDKSWVKLLIYSELAYNNFYKNNQIELQENIENMDGLLKKSPHESYYRSIYAIFYHLKGAVLAKSGDLAGALNCFQKSIENRDKNETKDLAYTYFNIGAINYILGNIQNALKFYNICLDLYYDSNDNNGIGFTLSHIGSILVNSGNNEEGFSKLEEGLMYSRKTNNLFFISESLFELIYLLISDHKFDDSLIYLKELEKIKNQTSNLIIQIRFNFCKALYLKNLLRIKDKVEAQNLFLEIINSDVANFEYMILAIKHYCDLLLDELLLTGNSVIIDEIKLYIEKLNQVSSVNNSKGILVDSILIQAKLLQIEGKVIESLELLKNAIGIAKEYKIDNLLITLNEEQNKVLKKVETIDFSMNADLKEKIKHSNLNEYLDSVEELVRKDLKEH